MCTVTWIREGDTYELFCNRDEKRSRLDARFPQAYALGDMKFLAPVDAEYGGTWIAVNEAGLGACLLNGAAMPVRRARMTRGAVIPHVIRAPDAAEALSMAGSLDLEQFPPFILLLLAPGGAARLLKWDGVDREIVGDADALMPLVSSSVDPAGVSKRRGEQFQRASRSDRAGSSAWLHDFHASHDGEPSAYSTCMHRPDAETVSFTHIAVSPHRIQLSYTPSAPCRQLTATRIELPR